MFNVGFIFKFLSALSILIFHRQGQAFEQFHHDLKFDDFVPALEPAGQRQQKIAFG